MSDIEMYDHYTPGVLSMMLHLLEHGVIPHVFCGDVEERPAYTGSVEVEGKLYALYFRRNSNTEVEVSITRNANIIKWTYSKDLFTPGTIRAEHHPVPGTCGHAKYLNDPWLLMRIYTAYVDRIS